MGKFIPKIPKCRVRAGRQVFAVGLLSRTSGLRVAGRIQRNWLLALSLHKNWQRSLHEKQAEQQHCDTDMCIYVKSKVVCVGPWAVAAASLVWVSGTSLSTQNQPQTSTHIVLRKDGGWKKYKGHLELALAYHWMFWEKVCCKHFQTVVEALCWGT